MTAAARFDADRMFACIEQQVALGPRRPGSAAGAANEDFLEGELRRLGLASVRREPIAITAWEPGDAFLEPVDPRAGSPAGPAAGPPAGRAAGASSPIEAFAIPYTAFTDGIVEAPLIFADGARLTQPGDWRGRVVVAEVRFPPLDPALLLRISLGRHDPDGTLGDVHHPATWVRLGWHLYRLAAQRGAAAFVGILVDQPGGSCRMYAPYGFRERDILDKPIPGFWVGREAGATLAQLARRGGRARFASRGRRLPAITYNLMGEIPAQSDETIVLSCHHDSPFASPVEDASGIAVVLALAADLAQRRALRRRVLVLLTAGHFYGSIGTRNFIAAHRHDEVARTVLEISIEHVAREAVEAADGRLVASGRPEPSALFVSFNRRLAQLTTRALADNGVDRALLLPAEGPLGDFPPTDGGDWYEAGVPLINCISNPVYLLTDDDALEWVDRARLPRVAGAFADLLDAVDGLSRAEIAAVDLPLRRLLMKALKHAARARTTAFGLKPIY